jgi:hypothetical protein
MVLNKLIKSTELALIKIVIINTQNKDLIYTANEKHKKRYKQVGTLNRARVIGGKIEGLRALKQAI